MKRNIFLKIGAIFALCSILNVSSCYENKINRDSLQSYGENKENDPEELLLGGSMKNERICSMKCRIDSDRLPRGKKVPYDDSLVGEFNIPGKAEIVSARVLVDNAGNTKIKDGLHNCFADETYDEKIYNEKCRKMCEDNAKCKGSTVYVSAY